jgi:MFS family permease
MVSCAQERTRGAHIFLIVATSVPGQVLIGWMSDMLDLRWSISLSTVGSALAVFLLWGFSERLPTLLLFACLYGFCSTGWVSWQALSILCNSLSRPGFLFSGQNSLGSSQVSSHVRHHILDSRIHALEDDPHMYTTLMSLFVASRGLGNVLSGPISTALMKHSPLENSARFGYGVKGYVWPHLFPSMHTTQTLIIGNLRDL